MPLAMFDRFTLEMSEGDAHACSHQGRCDDDVEAVAPTIARPDDCTPEALAAELKEYGAWDATELADDAANWHRIVWLAAGNIVENLREAEA